jgi:hypothetical protein
MEKLIAAMLLWVAAGYRIRAAGFNFGAHNNGMHPTTLRRELRGEATRHA